MQVFILSRYEVSGTSEILGVYSTLDLTCEAAKEILNNSLFNKENEGLMIQTYRVDFVGCLSTSYIDFTYCLIDFQLKPEK